MFEYLFVVVKNECPVCKTNPMSSEENKSWVDKYSQDLLAYRLAVCSKKPVSDKPGETVRPFTPWARLDCDHVLCFGCCVDFFEIVVETEKKGCPISVCFPVLGALKLMKYYFRVAGTNTSD